MLELIRIVGKYCKAIGRSSSAAVDDWWRGVAPNLQGEFRSGWHVLPKRRFFPCHWPFLSSPLLYKLVRLASQTWYRQTVCALPLFIYPKIQLQSRLCPCGRREVRFCSPSSPPKKKKKKSKSKRKQLGVFSVEVNSCSWLVCLIIFKRVLLAGWKRGCCFLHSIWKDVVRIFWKQRQDQATDCSDTQQWWTQGKLHRES